MSRSIAMSVVKRFKWGVRGMSNASDVIVKPESTEPKSNLRKMAGFQIHNYGEISELQHTEHVKKPYIRKPSTKLESLKIFRWMFKELLTYHCHIQRIH